jgi:copper resistance protein B
MSARMLAAAIVLTLVGSTVAHAQSSSPSGAAQSASSPAGWEPPVMDNTTMWHVLFDQLEVLINGPDNEFRWDGEGWIGTDMNKLWFKSEGFVEHGKATDGDAEALYDRPIPFLRYFDAQAGVRYDLDSNPGRTWGAIGVEGLAPYFFQFQPTFYFSNRGRFAGRLMGSYDLLITQRLILQPEIEMNFYSKRDPSRAIGSGLSDLDTGLRLRYEISLKFAPYIGVAYDGKFGETADFTPAEGGTVNYARFVFGIRLWY